MNTLNTLMQNPLLSGGEVSQLLIERDMTYRNRASTKRLSELLYCSQRNAQVIIKEGFKDEGLQALFYLQMQLAVSDK
ncbi:hypothetical protein [Vibrio harveyi]|uniref:hypothetical protein n=2 Tax=Vibrionaceae TaxID=641 RepID=UPI0006817A13|nr:hypothetical protein [Vibrio harveyi]MDK9774867.1 hypothetical protein [Vibrio sp. B181a]PNM41306.1 hypothetical protein AL469_014580 [Vibrio harveyi]